MKTKHLSFYLPLLVTVLLSMASCGKKYNFKTPKDAIDGCHEMLSELTDKKKSDAKDFTKILRNWQEIQDSSYSAFSKDKKVTIHSKYAEQYFLVSDSIRKQINRLAFSEERSLRDVIYIKVNSAVGKEKIQKSRQWKKANDFFDSLDDVPEYEDANTTVAKYEHLFKITGGRLDNQKQLLVFIKEEDRCFRSLMKYLSKIPQSAMQDITVKTADTFNRMYDRVGVKKDSVNDETMLYLTLRYNRRILQNAEACKKDIDNGVKLSEQMKGNYRWMLLQPFVTIDNYSLACLTDKQSREMVSLAESLPELMSSLSNNAKDNMQQEKLIKMLSTYFLRNYLLSTI